LLNIFFSPQCFALRKRVVLKIRYWQTVFVPGQAIGGVNPLRTWILPLESTEITEGTAWPMITQFCIAPFVWIAPDACTKSGLISAFSCGTARIPTVAEPRRIVAVAKLAGVQVASTVYCPAVLDAVKTPPLLIVPAITGVTDHVNDPPVGAAGMKTAVNGVTDPAATVIDAGVTESCPLAVVPLGFGKPLLLLQPAKISAKLKMIGAIAHPSTAPSPILVRVLERVGKSSSLICRAPVR
jgi:hypothetical protein